MATNMHRVDLSLMHKDESVYDYITRAFGWTNFRVVWVYEEWGRSTYADISVY
jgi:hypothetical protein